MQSSSCQYNQHISAQAYGAHIAHDNHEKLYLYKVIFLEPI